MDSLPRYAVLFKTHFWDDFVERQFRRLCLRVGPGKVFVVVDETKGAVPGILHDNIIRLTEEISEKEGYLRHPPGNLFWYNTDYQMYHFFDQFPGYDFVFTCEYDCVVDIDILTIIQAMASGGIDFVGERIATAPHDWHWTRSAQPYYTQDIEIRGRLLCCAAFSQRFALQLQAARRDHTRRVLGGGVAATGSGAVVWPNNEAFVGAEIARLRVPEAPLAAFADVSNYRWAPPYPEFVLSELPTSSIVHPVVDGRRYLRALRRLKWDIKDSFKEGSYIYCEMKQWKPEYLIPMFLRYFVEVGDFDAIGQLRDYAEVRCGSAAHRLFNVAIGKPATQSSISEWSRVPNVADDAAGAVTGVVTGHHGFHTNLDDKPWWCVDLEAVYPVSEIRIYNRLDQPSRARLLVVSVSRNLVEWHTVFQHPDDKDFGGADGKPLQIKLVNCMRLRFLRVHLPTRGLLHLDQVEVYV